jgi:hypothetical protein
MEKFKQVLAILKELWAIKSIRAIMILIGYFIFFTIVISIIRTGYQENLVKQNKPVLSAIDMLAEKKDYVSNITIEENKYQYKNEQDNEYLIINDVYYKINLDKLTPIDYNTKEEIEKNVPSFPIAFWKFTPKVIKDLVKIGTLEYKTEFTNKDVKKGYVIAVKDVLLTIDNIDNEDDNGDIKIELLERDNEIVEVSLDITNYYEVMTGTNFEFKFKIEY